MWPAGQSVLCCLEADESFRTPARGRALNERRLSVGAPGAGWGTRKEHPMFAVMGGGTAGGDSARSGRRRRGCRWPSRHAAARPAWTPRTPLDALCSFESPNIPLGWSVTMSRATSSLNVQVVAPERARPARRRSDLHARRADLLDGVGAPIGSGSEPRRIPQPPKTRPHSRQRGRRPRSPHRCSDHR